VVESVQLLLLEGLLYLDSLSNKHLEFLMEFHNKVPHKDKLLILAKLP
jgi:hypothetical protein